MQLLDRVFNITSLFRTIPSSACLDAPDIVHTMRRVGRRWQRRARDGGGCSSGRWGVAVEACKEQRHRYAHTLVQTCNGSTQGCRQAPGGVGDQMGVSGSRQGGPAMTHSPMASDYSHTASDPSTEASNHSPKASEASPKLSDHSPKASWISTLRPRLRCCDRNSRALGSASSRELRDALALSTGSQAYCGASWQS